MKYILSLQVSALLLLLVVLRDCCHAYVPQAVQERWKKEGYNMDKALKTIQDCAERREDRDKELYYAVRYIDRNAHHIYSDPKDIHALCQRSIGTWELRMGYEDARDQYFIPYPDFRDFAIAYAIIEDEYFGKGIASNPFFSYVAMGGPSKFNERTRQLYMNYKDFYISGRSVPDWDLSYFMRGYARNWYDNRRKRPPLAFTLIAATDNIMVVRGSKTGGMAIFKRIKSDMRPAAYGRR